MFKKSLTSRSLEGITQPLQRPRHHRGRLTLVLILAFAAGLLAAYIYIILRPKPLDQNSVNDVKVEVSRHMILPEEQPALATITDRSRVTSDFLKQAQNGDKILIYALARRVIIYRPSLDRIVDVGPIQIDTPGSK